MRDDFTKDWFGEGQDPAAYDPVRSARGALKVKLPKRFYTEVSTGLVEGQYGVLLDGKPARTRGRRLLASRQQPIAALVAAEWAAQGECIDPSGMPATRFLHAALDHVAQAMDEVRADIVKYAGSDLVCYRASEPTVLVERQAQLWDPVLAHCEARYGARFALSSGIRFVEQPELSIAAVSARLVDVADPIALTALHGLTTNSGSALIAIAIADGVMDADAGFDAGECDADYETGIWGFDTEAAERRIARLQEFRTAAMMLHLVGA
ncbi:COG5387 Chaperone required for the assembly of the mitochondrial F1-ATPase [Rhabdaerophilaceae bacterium]